MCVCWGGGGLGECALAGGGRACGRWPIEGWEQAKRAAHSLDRGLTACMRPEFKVKTIRSRIDDDDEKGNLIHLGLN